MKKNLKRIAGLILVAVLALAFTACSGGNEVAEYVDENGQKLVDAFETSLSSSGLTCESTIKADGNDIIIDTKIDQFVDIPEDQKSMMQEMFDGMKDSMKPSFGNVHEEIPGLESIIFNIREKDGDLVAKLELEF